MPIHISSLMKNEDGSFTPIQEWDGMISDPDYLEGALELTVNGVSLITPDMWDYIDQLWAYIFNTIEELTSKGSAWTYFPDQPIKLEMEKVESGMVQISVSIRPGKVDSTTKTEEKKLLQRLLEEGERFFLQLSESSPESRKKYENELLKLRKLRSLRST